MRTLLLLVFFLTQQLAYADNNGNCQTVNIPATIQSENFCAMSGIQTETTQDESGGLNIGYIDDDDWMSYFISVPSDGIYKIAYRVASQNGGNQLQIDKDKGATILGAIAIPSTGGWQTWETIEHEIQLSAGEYEIGVKAITGGFNINWFSITPVTIPPANTGFLHTSGKNIVDANGNNILLKSVNLDGWMVQEGYIMEVPFGPQWEIMNGITDVIGAQNAQQFHEAWLDNMVTEADFQQIKAWGFNSIRVPLHYNLFTLPIQDEPVAFQNTVLPRGYELVDRILAWAQKYELYLILDLHAAPGGQGEDQPISDYNPAYPSLWEEGENRSKTVQLWKEIASRYANEEWIAGYDLINETNWDLGENNQMLFELYESILWELRQVDNNHIVFIEGNWWANDFRGLTPAFDDNMVYAFHKYWSDVDQASIQEFVDLRNTTNTPIWCGETGENSNQWYAESFELLESNNIGYAFWPLKKVEQIQGLLKVEKPAGLQNVVDYWNGEGSKPSVAEAKSALMHWAQNTRIENCIYNYSVIDATTRMVGTNATIPYQSISIPSDIIQAVHYDLGKQGFAYYEVGDLGDYGNGVWWNNNWTFRNDAVDIYQIGGNGDLYIG
ncbi:carbohydrate-binding protein [Flammeovirga aprica]|uniref:Cellulase family glycosylhydrolase n=1 Tax=Flammeovirga aprica JL-4 TaxID=694437 RepID=A0A7X9RU36_9BACT|nr:carbohydrate-binding protein [Flammeovirga aprica]NME68674.1 cellulase family glycosylhydrolase [Flammeovirga aprica JL-4]